MREVKFRAWDKEYQEMKYNAEQAYDGCGQLHAIDCFGQLLEEENYKVMQYTGLKDKNGKEIYEGDIVKYCPNYRAFLAVDEIRNEIKRGVVVWNEQGFYAIDDNYPSNKDYMSYPVPMLIGGLEVIGNIYENLELLEKI